MRIYALKASGCYGGGMAIVAAPDPETAQKVAGKTIYDHGWQTQYGTPDEVELLPVEIDTDEPFVLVHYETGE